MYTTKCKVEKNADIGLLSIHTGGGPNKGDPYTKPRSKDPADDRFKGKQFSVEKHCSKPFSTFPFYVNGKGDAFVERISYRNVEKKNGFGSSDAPKRDEFSNTIAIKKYRETVKSELNSSKYHALMAAKKQREEKSNEEPEEEPTKIETKEETFEYDQIFKVKHDTGIGKPKSWKPMNLGTTKTTTSMYGQGCHSPSRNSKNGRSRATAEFLNSGHLHLEDDDY